eukprot:gb/GECG01010903.1/.p1 GENE.gb/GECG01010903.1/~~gb/GECG01010903.1/.p1  ORF type:complete len:214 (+),score=16.23 gb/GECG01010903.1/:1-642(+)
MTLASHLPRCATQPRVVLDVMVQPEVRRYFICFPEGRALDKVITENYRRTSLNGVVGAIDGSHIPIKGQFWRRDVATNRKLSYSMVLQAVAGPDLQLYDVDVGVWGSCHDARVFSTSELGDRILGDRPLPFPQDSASSPSSSTLFSSSSISSAGKSDWGDSVVVAVVVAVAAAAALTEAADAQLVAAAALPPPLGVTFAFMLNNEWQTYCLQY